MWQSLKDLVLRKLQTWKMERLGQLGTRKRRTTSAWGDAADHSMVLTIVLALILWAVCVTVLTLPTLRTHQSLVPNQLAPTTIFARTDFTYEDKAATAKRREDATKNEPLYLQISRARNEQIRQNANELFSTVAARLSAENAKKVYVAPAIAVDRQVAALSPSAFQILAHVSNEKLLREEFLFELESLLNNGVIAPGVIAPDAAPDAPARIIDELERNRKMRPLSAILTEKLAVADLTALLLSYRPEARVAPLDREALEQLMSVLFSGSGNLVVDTPRTISGREEAQAAVTPVWIDVKKNEPIVRRNQLVDLKILDALNAHDASLTLRNQDVDRHQKLFQNLFWSFVMILFVGFYLYHIHPEIMRSNRKISLTGTVVGLSLLINYLSMEFFYFLSSVLAIPPALVVDAVPLALPAVLLVVMVGFRVAIYIGFFVALISALMLDSSFDVALEGMAVCSLVALAVRSSTNYRSFFVRIFLSVAITVWLLDFNLFWHIFSSPEGFCYTALMALGNALFTAVAGLLLTFLFELLFNVSTNMSLMVLCDFNHPLLKELHMRAPGTSLHCQNVAMLAENAAIEIHANPIRARAAALFHDIGKIKNPEYFTENNLDGVNLHTKLSPRMSSIIIMNHVKDGLDLALQHKLCTIVRNAISQHHGTDLLQFFYRLAQQGENPVVEGDYRYPGPLPHDKEVVIVSLADACEAACRSLEKPTPSKIEAMVHEIFRKRWRDGQLDHANLTIQELAELQESFVRTLTTMYHGRIAYPKDGASENENDLFMAQRTPADAEPKTAVKSNS